MQYLLTIVTENFALLVVNPAGEWTRTYCESPDPDIMNRDNNSLLQSATLNHDQVALKELVCIDLLPTIPLNAV